MYDRRISSKLNLLRAISKMNKGRYIDPHQVDIIDVKPFRGGETNTTAKIVPKAGAKVIDEVAIRYVRRDIAADIREPLKLDPHKQLYTSELLPQLNRKYGFALEDSDIVNKKIDTSKLPVDVQIEMSQTNLVWLGFIPVRISEPKESLVSIVSETDLTVEEGEVGKPSADLLYYGEDFTVIGPTLALLEVGQELTKDDRDTLNGTVEHRWVNYSTNRQWNLKAAGVKYNGKTKVCPHPCNPDDYENVLILQLGPLCSNYTGNLVLHYN